jgi:hypothetical protein
MTRSTVVRRRFLRALWNELQVVWPILSGLVGVQLVLGMLVGRLEGWPVGDATYFTFATGLTIGYGDFVPAHFVHEYLQWSSASLESCSRAWVPRSVSVRCREPLGSNETEFRAKLGRTDTSLRCAALPQSPD